MSVPRESHRRRCDWHGAWYRKFIASKWDFTTRRHTERPTTRAALTCSVRVPGDGEHAVGVQVDDIARAPRGGLRGHGVAVGEQRGAAPCASRGQIGRNECVGFVGKPGAQDVTVEAHSYQGPVNASVSASASALVTGEVLLPSQSTKLSTKPIIASQRNFPRF